MDSLIALGQILLASIPTFLLVWILYFYASRVFFGPLRDTLKKRYDVTAGLRQRAEASLASAEQKAAQYEQALRSARAGLYAQQEQERQRALELRADRIREAQQRAEAMLAKAKQEIRQEVDEAKMRLVTDSEQIAASITRAILQPAMAGPSRSGARTEAGR